MRDKRYLLGSEIFDGLLSSFQLAGKNNEFLLFWLIGVILHALAFNTFNSYAWMAISVFDWMVGVFAIRDTTRPIEQAFAHCGVSFTSGFGTPKWVIRDRYPCASNTIEFTACGHPAETYQEHVARISTGLNLPIRTISEDRPGAQVLQAHIVRTQIPKHLDYSEVDLSHLGQGQFVYGKDAQGFKHDDLKEAIHLLVAGQTGSGKTYFIQQLAVTVLKKSREAHLVVIDMKGGIDFMDFKKLPNCELITTHKDAHAILDALYAIHELRSSYLKEKGKRNWRDLSLKDLSHDPRFSKVPIGPILLVTDELAELTGNRSESVTKQSVHSRLSQFGRLARATGIHLIGGTQRPDKTVIDGQTKDSLVTRVCFSVPSVTASTLVVGDMSAFTIGRHPGRAVVSNGSRFMVQAPFLSSAALKEHIEELCSRLKQQQYERLVSNGVDSTEEQQETEQVGDEPEAS